MHRFVTFFLVLLHFSACVSLNEQSCDADAQSKPCGNPELDAKVRALATHLDGTVSTLTTDPYEFTFGTHMYNHLYLYRRAAVVVNAISAGDVSAAVRFAKEEDFRIVVHNTGHDFLGRSLQDDAVVINLSRMKGVNVNAISKEVQIAAGETWYDVYKALEGTNLHVVGGDGLSVGAAGGYHLGGGRSFTNFAFGLSVDNVLRYQAVLVTTGESVEVSATSHPDLFFALRGGGAGYCVILSIVLRLHEYPEVIQGISWRDTTAPAVPVGELLDGFATDWGDQWGGFIYTAPGVALVDLLHMGTRADGQPVINALGPMFGGVENVPVKEYKSYINWQLKGKLPDPIQEDNVWTSTQTVFLSKAEIIANKNTILEILFMEPKNPATGQPVPGASRLCLFIPSGGAVTANSKNDVPIIRQWRNAAATLFCSTRLTEETPRDQFEALTKAEWAQMSTVGSGVYYNYASPWLQNWQDQIWGEHYSRLLAIKQNYDPNWRFSTCQFCVGSEVVSPKP